MAENPKYIPDNFIWKQLYVLKPRVTALCIWTTYMHTRMCSSIHLFLWALIELDHCARFWDEKILE